MKLLDNGAVLMTQREVDDLLEYSTSLPTGTTPGKAWKKRVPPWAPKAKAEWRRGSYGKPYPEGHKYHGEIPIGWRSIRIEGREPFFPVDVRVPPPPMRGRMVAYVPPAPPPPDLPDGLWERSDGRLMYECIGCGRATELLVEADEFDPDVAYCGGSPRCLP